MKNTTAPTGGFWMETEEFKPELIKDHDGVIRMYPHKNPFIVSLGNR